MKKVLLVFFCVLVILLVAGIVKFRQSTDRLFSPTASAVLPTDSPTPQPTPVSGVSEHTSLFIPYWAVGKTKISSGSYAQLVYFGVAVTPTGVDRTEAGYTNLPAFLRDTDDTTPKLLTIRMTDSQTNLKVLASKTDQTQLISDAVGLAKRNGFSGVVLDLEITGLPFDSLINQISDFSTRFATATKAQQLTFNQLVYGDTFYRLRPFAIKSLAANTDQMMVMAYDFHKARGNPGPNFPLNGRDTYGYDFKKMTDDFLQFVPANKLTVVFGLFGYDWPSASSATEDATASPVTDKEITAKFFPSCTLSACQIQRDAVSAETKITYKDTSNISHTVWYEDQESAQTKEAYLKTRGIGNFSYWAYSYF